MISKKQILDARRVSGLSQVQLAAEAMIPLKTLQNIEVGRESLRPEWAATLKVTLERRGVLFRASGEVEMKPGFLHGEFGDGEFGR